MIARSAITLNRGSWPAWLKTAENVIDAALTTPAWDLNTERFRELTHSIAAVPQGQKWMLGLLVRSYTHVGGWNVEITQTTESQWTVRFSLNGA